MLDIHRPPPIAGRRDRTLCPTFSNPPVVSTSATSTARAAGNYRARLLLLAVEGREVSAEMTLMIPSPFPPCLG
jgi:hypothetical protein